ncbi:hypothetical protein CBF68_05505 [Lactobacillus taiwanensis]|uniref:DUF3862 domain-containing protein n=1 Tax=Lactobacillus taiwanensis TaxID=508451 RepID=UPI000B99A1E4|nr:DUF3862 domain-containing protein [Lactobacillus taiwanensis]OYS00313.1 hypothetical protein CBF64_03275 [Lactobacillus taiwanensis]OYS03754.1 hypothetical protein CBF68_05505 [Lactobacillus taiwanensis]
MKKKYLVAATGLALLGLSMSACSSNSGSKSDPAKTSQQTKKNETISQNKELREKFDQIKVGELSNHGEGGSTIQDVEKLLGKPNTTDTTTVDSYKTKSYIWNKGAVTVTVQFAPDKVVTKDITGFKWGKRDEKLDLAAFNGIQDGTSYDDVVKKYGEPDSLNESLLLGTKTVTGLWYTGIKGKADGAFASLTFENGALTSKTQTDLK